MGRKHHAYELLARKVFKLVCVIIFIGHAVNEFDIGRLRVKNTSIGEEENMF